MMPTVLALIGLAALLIADGWFAGMAIAARLGGWPRWHAPTAVGGTMRLVRPLNAVLAGGLAGLVASDVMPTLLHVYHPWVQTTSQRLGSSLIVVVAASLIFLLRDVVPAAVVWRNARPAFGRDAGSPHGRLRTRPGRRPTGLLASPVPGPRRAIDASYRTTQRALPRPQHAATRDGVSPGCGQGPVRFAPRPGQQAVWAVCETEVFMIERLDDRLFLADGACLVRDLNRLCGFAIPESDAYATLGGFLVALLRRQPRVEEVVEHEGWRYTIVQVAGKGVGQVLVARPGQDGTGETRIDKP
ncbi:MAG TPA: transporter associated domain-containing protein [Alphaproteobacteria bacterium]|nr:transporter associated domain-containing protein [Alphaproteobacteria bacterium]